ncbi:MAG TPA: phosphatase PAP2 family protein [Vicinamibacterales bacterium]|nr:phosphatase PAP2 family protein [Vicinamibacterales bacterium]
MISRSRFRAAAIAVTLSIVAAVPARAQTGSASSGAQPDREGNFGSVRLQPDRDPAVDDVPSFGEILTGTLRAFQHLPSRTNFELLALGGIAAPATHPADSETSRVLSGSVALDEPFEAGAFLGGTPFQIGAAFATYGLGRAFHNSRIARAGADLVQAQLVAEALTMGIKQATRRARPEGSGYSFPSGHTTVSFASATVLHRHFGWKAGIPAYLAAAYVGTARIQTRRHYLSDVAFGAALGAVAGRTVTLNRRHGVGLSVAPVNGGGAVLIGIAR